MIGDGGDSENEMWRAGLAAVEDHFLRWTGNRLEPLVLTIDGLARAVQAGEPLVQSWQQDALTVHGRDLRALLADLTLPRTR